jgi:hypothetical protein
MGANLGIRVHDMDHMREHSPLMILFTSDREVHVIFT